jgi:hypothetical protein
MTPLSRLAAAHGLAPGRQPTFVFGALRFIGGHVLRMLFLRRPPARVFGVATLDIAQLLAVETADFRTVARALPWPDLRTPPGCRRGRGFRT